MFTDTLIASLPHLAASLLAEMLAKTAKYCWFNRYAFLQWIFRKVHGLASFSKTFAWICMPCANYSAWRM
jgi:hypothetical protein